MQCPICHGIHYFQSILYLKFQRGTRKCACHSLFKSVLNTLKNSIRHFTGCLEVERYAMATLKKHAFSQHQNFFPDSQTQINKFLIWNKCNMYRIVIDQKLSFMVGIHKRALMLGYMSNTITNACNLCMLISKSQIMDLDVKFFVDLKNIIFYNFDKHYI